MNDEGALAAAVPALRMKYGAVERETFVVDAARIVAALEQFQECVRYLNTRRTNNAILTLDSEAAVQDALYLMLRPWILDVVAENPTDRAGNRFGIKDFVSKNAQTVIEVKYIRDKAHGQAIAKELHDDIETYRSHPACKNLVFFIYDPESLIPDQGALRRQIVIERQYAGVPIVCYLVVKP